MKVKTNLKAGGGTIRTCEENRATVSRWLALTQKRFTNAHAINTTSKLNCTKHIDAQGCTPRWAFVHRALYLLTSR